ncbi:MAG: phosphoribosylpyrophosphate synthetase [Aestuariibaculum sp.]
MEDYDNLIEGIAGLKKQGYVEDFNLKENCLECRKGQYKIFHNEFEIDKTFRFEDGDSSPESSSILYAISSEKYKLKGIMVNSYGIYSDTVANEMLNKLKFAK